MLAMSGGVDSSVAGQLLLEAGHEVVGVTMRLWGGDSDTGCCSVSDVDDARRVAQQLGVDHVVFNFGEEFDTHVVAPYVQAHVEGTTPNPCIECNRHLKFDRLARRAELLGFDAVATGHHARIRRDHQGVFRLGRGVDRLKDQSYVVHMLSQQDLSRTLFPVGELTKDEVRRRAVELGLRTADKPDSQDVCFITSTGGRETFLGHRIPLRRASVVDDEGTQLGELPAVELVTLGQRRGLGLPGGGPKRYVVEVDVPTATVVVGSADQLLSTGVLVEQMTWTHGAEHHEGPGQVATGDALVQCSAHGVPRPARISRRSATSAVFEWHTPQPAVAPGQSVVVYDRHDEHVLGGGIVTEIHRS
jgi:tRNA-specific 2-thiouridylase